MEVEATVVPVETEVLPHPSRLHQDLGADLGQEPDVALDVDVPPDGVGDVGVEVVLGGAGLIERRRLVAVDRPPREQRPAKVEERGALARLGQHAVAEPQDVPGDPGLGVREERQHVRLGVPEVVAVVGGPGEPLGGDAGALDAPRRLAHLEQVPAHRLLHSDGVVPIDDDHVGRVPEPVEVGPLDLDDGVEAVLQGAIERAMATRRQVAGRHAPRGLVGDVLHHPRRHARLGLNREHPLAQVGGHRRGHAVRGGRQHDVLHADCHRHPAVRDLVAVHRPPVGVLGEARLEDAVR